MSANTQDLIVKRCWVEAETFVKAQGIVCEVEWHEQTTKMPLDSILNEINKSAVFAHGIAQAAQKMKRYG